MTDTANKGPEPEIPSNQSDTIRDGHNLAFIPFKDETTPPRKDLTEAKPDYYMDGPPLGS